MQGKPHHTSKQTVIWKKVKLISVIQTQLSGATDTSLEIQLISELKQLKPHIRKKIWKHFHEKEKVTLTKEVFLAMKEAVGLIQRQVDIQNKFLKGRGTSFPNENVVRKFSKGIKDIH